MAASSLVAFGVVFAGATLALSALFTVILLAVARVLRRAGPWAERRAAAAALASPPLLAAGLVAILALGSALAIRNGTDHCLDHSHHLHLCLRHGLAWASRPWALTLVVFLATFVTIRSVLSGWAHWGAQRAASRLRRVGVSMDHPSCYLVPARERFAFTAGLFAPAVVVSTAAWDALDEGQRGAVLAHELGHVANRDLWIRALLGLAGSFGVPFLVTRALRLWEVSAERICDRRAATVERPSTVAGAMLTLARSTPPKLAPEGAVFAAASHVQARVESLLRDEPGGERLSRRLSIAAALASVGLAIAGGLCFEPLHHVLETILG